MTANEQSYEVWWNNNEREALMEEGHLKGWLQLIAALKEEDLSEYSVLDFGCNRGGFLRLLHQIKPYKKATGIDLGRQSIDIANERKGSLPIDYRVSGSPEQLEGQFDLAFCLSVIYLIDDLKTHAWKLSKALKPGGVYYVTYTDLTANPSRDFFKEEIEKYSHLNANMHTLDDIASAFSNEGFRVEIKRRVPTDFITVSGKEKYFRNLNDELMSVYENGYIFRFTKM
ncbi:class I SAM-dependent methyltransferase [Paenibacillus doosanensis]|uniref:Bifunctional 3-demethylubiquinone-9 3-methyltransferase/ 2-octaprenyl-6-hydroxy phenol methylase n=1 Tax=Paenibacillus konkukensis TaxID=2020716 RepID=A0ABY4RHH0_9BACL|nr:MULTISPECIES: class I SAM-dependent methyltransferase [Paenibacillus]MCS7461308.1 class I SAM-dependent methyltransferase [Paenibacillus doosanensis]UQZ81074.1 bifunctional 3-demethylubiquinone-9 3-methyltransferase/ 2-octaprenyl-6-hydroxy phenol methylase [Paenibacillus konkukensis]